MCVRVRISCVGEALAHEAEVGGVVEGPVPVVHRVGDAEAEALGDGFGDVLGEPRELVVDAPQLRRQRRGLPLLLPGDATGGEQREQEEGGDPPAVPRGLCIAYAHSDAEEKLQERRPGG